MNIKKKILILGSNGFFGKNLKKLLKCSDRDLIYIERKDIDILDKEKLNQVFNNLQPSVVINCCGLIGSSESNKLIDQFTILNINLMLNINILNCCDRYNIEKLITFSTYRLFTDVDENYNEEDINFIDTNVDNAGYLLSKAIMDKQIKLLKQKSNINIICFFLPNIFGFFDKFSNDARIVPSLINKIYLAKKDESDLYINSNSANLVNIIFINDIVRLVHTSIYENIDGNILVFNEKSTFSLFQLTQILSTIMNFKKKINFKEHVINENKNIMKPNLYNFKKKITNFTFTDTHDALNKTIDFFYSSIVNTTADNDNDVNILS